MNAIMVTCPNCGARLEVIGDSETVTCEYCDTAARVARRTRFSRVMTPPAIGPTPIAVQRHATRALVWFVGLIFIAPVVIIALVIFLVTSKIEHAAKSRSRSSEARCSCRRSAGSRCSTSRPASRAGPSGSSQASSSAR